MATKYKILWFLVDTYHRERYFFICGCKQIVKNSGRKTRREAAQRREVAVNFKSPFPVLCKRFKLFPSRLHCAG